MEKDKLLELVEQSHFLLPQEKYKLFLSISESDDLDTFQELALSLQKHQKHFDEKNKIYQRTCIDIYTNWIQKTRTRIWKYFQTTLSIINQKTLWLNILIQESSQWESNNVDDILTTL